MTQERFLAYLRETIRKRYHGSQTAAAKQWGISQAYLSDVLRGNRKPGQSILEQLGFERIESYMPTRSTPCPKP